jgi:ribosome biogenesis protein Tsr3
MRTDRRTDPRSMIDLLVNKYIGDDPHICRAVNLSRRGMLLYKVFEPDLPMSDVTIEFQLPGDEHVLRASGITLAEHRWARAHGVRFTRILDEDIRRIEAYLTDPKRLFAAL